MKAKWIAIGGGGVVLAALAVGLLTRVVGLRAGSCLTDDEISAAERAPYEQTAQRFARHVVTGDIDGAYAEFTDELKRVLARDRLDAMMRPMAPALRTLTALRVTHSYTLKGFGAGADQLLMCTAVARGSTATPEGKVLVAATPAALQAHVIVEGDIAGGAWTMVLWVLPEHDAWRVRSFYIVPISAGGRSASDLWTQAREERSRGHAFNAAILFAAASELAFRGPNFQLGIWQEMQNEAKTLQLPAELQGQPPFTWRFGGDTFRVDAIGHVRADGKAILLIRRSVGSLADAKRIEDENVGLIHGIAARFPEHKDVFDTIVVDAISAGRAVRTVEPVRGSP